VSSPFATVLEMKKMAEENGGYWSAAAVPHFFLAKCVAI